MTYIQYLWSTCDNSITPALYHPHFVYHTLQVALLSNYDHTATHTTLSIPNMNPLHNLPTTTRTYPNLYNTMSRSNVHNHVHHVPIGLYTDLPLMTTHTDIPTPPPLLTTIPTMNTHNIHHPALHHHSDHTYIWLPMHLNPMTPRSITAIPPSLHILVLFTIYHQPPIPIPHYGILHPHCWPTHIDRKSVV